MQLNNVFLLPCIGWELGGRGSLRKGERGFVVDDCIYGWFLHI